jgi:hypothetical protein
MNGWTKWILSQGCQCVQPPFSNVVFFPGVVTKTSQRGLQGVREETVVLDAAAGSNLPAETVSKTGDASIRSAVFLLKLGNAKRRRQRRM